VECHTDNETLEESISKIMSKLTELKYLP